MIIKLKCLVCGKAIKATLKETYRLKFNCKCGKYTLAMNKYFHFSLVESWSINNFIFENTCIIDNDGNVVMLTSIFLDENNTYNICLGNIGFRIEPTNDLDKVKSILLFL